MRHIACIVLAAGRAERMGGVNKLLEPVGGLPLVRRAVVAALESAAQPVLVVTGHENARIEAALAGLKFVPVFNAEYRAGLSSSLKAGVRALSDEADGALFMLADMPEISASHLDRLIDAFDPDAGHAIVVPTHAGRRGNPVLWGAALFPELLTLTGDAGAKRLLAEHEDLVREVAFETDAVLMDIDTPAELAAARARQNGA
jgi:molybdenum cofactor cytidylyltransferase